MTISKNRFEKNKETFFGIQKMSHLGFFSAILALLFFISVPVASASVLVMPPNNIGLVGYWPMNEGAGTRASDFSGSGNNGTLVSSPSWVTGKLDKALSFTGTNYVDIGTGSSLNPTAITVSAWIKGSSFPNAYNTIVHRGNGTVYYEYYIKSTGKIAIYLANGGTPSSYDGTGTNTLNTNAWYHVVFTYDSSAGLKGYVNGVLDGTAAAQGAMTAVSSNAHIGDDSFTAGRKFNGTIDDVRIYNRALSAAEVVNIYQSGFAKINTSYNNQLTSGLVGLWSFDGADISGTTAYDRSGSGNNGTLTNGPVRNIGKIGQTLNFDGTNDYVTMGTPSALNLTGTLSISAWIYPTSFGGTSKGRIVDKDSSVSAGYIFAVDNSNTTSGIGFLINTANVGTESFFVANSITLNKWQHVAVTMNASKLVTIYVNGVSVGSSTLGAFPSSGTDSFVIGGRTTDNFRNFAGKIDEFRIYNRDLTQAEITKLYAMGSGTRINSSQNNISGSSLQSGLVSLWSFDGADLSGTTAYDRSGSGNNGTLTNGPVRTIGKIGQALTFNGTNSEVTTTTNYGNASSLTNISLSAWFKTSTASGNKIIGMENAQTGTASVTYDRELYVNTSGSVVYSSSDGTQKYATSLAATYADGKWHHAVGVQTAGSSIQLYVDGVLQQTTAFGTSYTGFASSFWRIGAYLNAGTGGANGYFSGSLDDIRVYNRALTASEVRQLYLLGK